MNVQNDVSSFASYHQPDNRLDEMIQAIEEGDITTVQKQLSFCSNELFRKYTFWNGTLLTTACAMGHEEIALLLIERMSVEDLIVPVLYSKTSLECALVSRQYRAALSIAEKLPTETLLKRAGQYASYLHLALFFGAKRVLLHMIQRLSPQDIAQLDGIDNGEGVNSRRLENDENVEEPFIHKLLCERLIDAEGAESVGIVPVGVASNDSMAILDSMATVDTVTTSQRIYHQYFSKISIQHLVKSDRFGQTPLDLLRIRRVPNLDTSIFNMLESRIPSFTFLREQQSLGMSYQRPGWVDTFFSNESVVKFVLQRGSDNFISHCWYVLGGRCQIFDDEKSGKPLLELAIARETEAVALLILSTLSLDTWKGVQPDGWSSLLASARSGNAKKVHAVISHHLKLRNIPVA